MAIYLYAIAVQKVQSFLFDALQSHEQEKQTDKQTLRKVFFASQTISEGFNKTIFDKFESQIITIEPHEDGNVKLLPTGSGMVMFAAQDTDIKDTINDFCVKAYKEYKGLMRVSYARHELKESDYKYQEDSTIILNDSALSVIKKLKMKLQSPCTFNKIIKDNQEILFNFQKVESNNDLSAIKHCKTCFADDFSELRPDNDTTDDNRYYIAFLKADLDGMGNAFKNVKTLSGYSKMSNILSKWVCPDGIEKAIEEVCSKEKNNKKALKVYPIYAAGDDIFCAVKVNDIVRAVKVYKYILDKINEELRDTKNDGDDAVKLNDGKIVQLSMRIGIDITWENQPIRYYWQRAENQMEKCRGNVPDLLKDSGYAKIAIGDVVFLDYRKDDIIHSDYSSNQKFIKEYAKAKKGMQLTYLRKNLPENFQTIINKHDERQNLTDNERKLYKVYISERRKKLSEKDYKNELAKLRKIKPENGRKTYLECINQDKLDDVNISGNYPKWHDFISDIGYINFSCGGGLHLPDKVDDKRVLTTSHLFNLLNALESNDTKLKYTTNVLYRLMPEKIRSIEGVKRDITLTEDTANVLTDEAVIWHIIAKKLVKKKFNNNRCWTENTVVDITQDSDDIRFVIAYIKLLLLFCDPRFNINVGSLSEDTIDFKLNDTVDDLNNFYTMFLDYLLNAGRASKYESLFKMFADKTKGKLRFYTENSKHSHKTKTQQRESYNDFIILSIVEKSMLFRFKNLLQTLEQGVAAEKAVEMIKNKKGNILPTENPLSDTDSNKATIEKVREYNSWMRRQLNENYNADNFSKLKEYFDNDFVDLLIVFYSYISVRAAYKAIKLDQYFQLKSKGE